MRQIYKKNSLEDCISRLHGILPALNKEWVINYGNLYKKYETYNDAYEVALHGSIDFSNIEEKILVITHCNCLERAKEIKNKIVERYNFKDILIVSARGLSSTYENEGGIIISY